MHTIDTLTTQLRNDLPNLKPEASDDHTTVTFTGGKTAKVYLDGDAYTVEQGNMLGKPYRETHDSYEALRGYLGNRNRFQPGFSYDEPVRAFLAAINEWMEKIGWSFAGPDGLDGCVGGWTPEDYDVLNPPRGLTDLAVNRVEVEDGTVTEVELVATGEGYQPYEETTLGNDGLVGACVSWFEDQLCRHADE